MGEKPLAIIIEDDLDLSYIFSEALSAAGYRTHAIRDGESAVRDLPALAPQLIILDLHLPGQSGTDVLAFIRSHDVLGGARVVVTTADTRLAETVERDADVVLIKPIGFNLMRELTAKLGAP